jgi:hypothetical protein
LAGNDVFLSAGGTVDGGCRERMSWSRI